MKLSRSHCQRVWNTVTVRRENRLPDVHGWCRGPRSRSAAPWTRKADMAQTIMTGKATVIMWRWRKGYEAAPFQSSIPTKVLTGSLSIYRGNRKVVLPTIEKYSSANDASPRRIIAGSRFWVFIRLKVAENLRKNRNIGARFGSAVL